MPIPKAVAKLAVPTVLSSLVMVLYNLADTWFVGLLNDPIQNAAITLAAPVLLAFNAINNLFGVGASGLMGRALGRKELETVRRASAFGFWAATAGGVLFSVCFALFQKPLLSLLGAVPENIDATANYLFWTVTLGAAPSILNVVLAYLVRAEGSSMHASVGTMSGCFLNILLDPLFVLPQGLGLGAAGAGLATFLSNCTACLYFFILLFVRRKKTVVCLKPRMAIPQKAIVKEICAVGIPAALQNLLNVTGMTVLNNFTADFGSDAVAAMGIAYKISLVPNQIAFGLTQGVMPLVSYNYGSRDYTRAKKCVVFSGGIAVSALTVVAALIFIFPGRVMRLFIENASILSYGARFLRGMALALPLLCTDFLGVMVFQAFGKGIYSLFFAILRKIVLEIPALILLNRLVPLYGLAYAQFATELVLSVVSVCCLFSIFRRLEKGAAPQAKRGGVAVQPEK